MAKKKSTTEPTFEESLMELETLAADLDDGSAGLDESLEKFERAIGLLRNCYDLLESAETKVAELTGFDADGNPVERPFDGSSTAEQGGAGRRKSKTTKSKSKSSEEDEDSDGGLF